MPELGLLALAGMAAGYINAVAGAGSLLTLPALIFTGLDAPAANATNRIAVLFQNGAALLTFQRGGVRVPREGLLLCIPASLGALAGAWTATLMSDRSLRVAIAAVMAVFVPIMLIPRRKTPAKDRPGLSRPVLWSGTVAIGFYAGFLQAGTGILLLLFLSVAHNMRLVAGNTTKLLVVLVLTVGAIAVFVMQGIPIDPLRGCILAVATTAGAYVGARMTLAKGSAFIRSMLLVAVLLSVGKLLWDAFAK